MSHLIFLTKKVGRNKIREKRRREKCRREKCQSGRNVFQPTTTTTTSKATTTTAAPCKDKISSNSCKSYAAKGYCTKYSKMKRDCPKTCKFCGGNSTTTSTTTTKTTAKTTTTTAKPCKDNKSNCKKWAAKGLCTKNGYVKRNCKKSCNFCGGSTSTTTKPKTCKDKISCCKELAGQGYCKYSFIKVSCKKSCGQC